MTVYMYVVQRIYFFYVYVTGYRLKYNETYNFDIKYLLDKV